MTTFTQTMLGRPQSKRERALTAAAVTLTAFQSEARPLIQLAIPLIAGSLSYTLIGLTNSYFLGPLGAVLLH